MNKEKLCDKCSTCNQKSPLFQLLSDNELEVINDDRYAVRFLEGEVILKQGTRADNLVYVIEGFAKMYVEGFNDRNLLLDFVKPMQFVGAPAVHTGGKYNYTMVAVRETLACFLDAEKFSKALDLNREFSKHYMVKCSEEYARSLDRMVSLSQKQMHGRIADALIYLSEQVYETEVIGVDVSRQDIADFTGMSKDSAIRILKEFERDGIVNLEDKTIVIHDGPLLNSISMNG
ncbi:MAG: Crp/Fnr family transcriptional regulator [Bacteroidota bacterium]